MHYQFHRDASGRHCANFDAEHTIMAYWLETTFSHASTLTDLERLIAFCQKIDQGAIDEHQSSQHGYYLQVNAQSVSLIALSTLRDPRTEKEKSDGKMDFDNMSECKVELSLFVDLLIDWKNHLSTVV